MPLPIVELLGTDRGSGLRDKFNLLARKRGYVDFATKTAAYTVGEILADSTEIVLCDATAGAFTVTLPPAATNTGRVIGVKKTDSSANAVTIDGNAAELIDGAATLVITAQNAHSVLGCDGVGWKVLWSVSGTVTSGSLRIASATKTANYTATVNDELLIFDCSAAARTLTLMAASTFANRTLRAIKGDTSANALTIDGNAAELVDGAATMILTGARDAVHLWCSGTEWYVL